jgi:thermitase
MKRIKDFFLKHSALIAFCFLVITLFLTSTVHAAWSQTDLFQANSDVSDSADAPVSADVFLIKYRNTEGLQTVQKSKAQILEVHKTGQLVKVLLDGQILVQSYLALSKDKNIEYIVPNSPIFSFERRFWINPTQGIFKNSEFQPDLLERTQWAIEKVQAKNAWQKTGNKGSRNITVAVIDTGVDYNHNALKSNMVTGYDFIGRDDDPMDDTGPNNPGHGTHCAGVVGANGISGATYGVSPEVSIMPLRFLGSNGGGDTMDAIKSIDFAVSKKVQVISASWGNKQTADKARPLIEAVERAKNAGIIFVAAAGNDGKDNDSSNFFPANVASINVGASDSSDARPFWSNYGSKNVHVAAPGAEILSTLPGNSYGNLDGTSMAAPLVSGLAAFLLAQDPYLNARQVKAIIEASGDKVPIKNACQCRINVLKAAVIVKDKLLSIEPAVGSLQLNEKLKFANIYGKPPFKFSVSNEQIASIDEEGNLLAKNNGEVQITITDATGANARSQNIIIGTGGGTNPPQDPPKPPDDPPEEPDPEKCPFQNPKACEYACKIDPTLRWCK